ncbi:MAG TPA: tetratricopeptide repeat protein, partial [Methylomirabilota bacterium]|nr:tetratricopeptide repeat protein [Methylomirabilota bacterium]
MSLTDRYGLTLSTASSVAARHYQDGMDRMLSYGFGADQAFAAAVAADEGFALAHAGAALFSLFQGDGASAKT